MNYIVSKHAYMRFKTRFQPLFRRQCGMHTMDLIEIVIKSCRCPQRWKNIPFYCNSLTLDPKTDNVLILDDKKLLFIIKDGVIVTATYLHENYNHQCFMG